MSVSFDNRLVARDDDDLSAFMEETPEAIVVDRREEEQDIVQSVSDALEPDALSCSWLGEEDLVLRYNETDRRVGLTFSPQDRYISLRAINDLLRGHYELRLFEPSYESDTHQFLIKSSSWWAAFDHMHPKRSADVFRTLDDSLDFP